MENLSQLHEQPQPIAAPAPSITVSKPLGKQPMFIAVSSLAIIAVVGLILLLLKSTVLQKKLDEQGKTLAAAQIAISNHSTTIDSLKENAAKISDIDSRQTSTAKMAYIAYLQHDIEGGVVTDDFIVDKIYLTPTNDNKLGVIINIDTQPSMAVHYQGKGSFDLPDRELRAKSLAIIKAVKERYTGNMLDILPAWDDANVRLTIKNYDVGDTIDGDFKLVGEK